MVGFRCVVYGRLTTTVPAGTYAPPIDLPGDTRGAADTSGPRNRRTSCTTQLRNGYIVSEIKRDVDNLPAS